MKRDQKPSVARERAVIAIRYCPVVMGGKRYVLKYFHLRDVIADGEKGKGAVTSLFADVLTRSPCLPSATAADVGGM